MASQWYFRTAGEELGPITFRELVDLTRSGVVTETDLVRSSWMTDWQRAESVVGLFHMAGRSPEELAKFDPPPVPAPQPVVADVTAETDQRPGWMKRLLQIGGKRKSRPAEIPILGPVPVGPATEIVADLNVAASSDAQTPGRDPAAGVTSATDEKMPAELAAYWSPAGNAAGGEWSQAVDGALAAVESHGSKPPHGRWGKLVGRFGQAPSGKEDGRSLMRVGFRVVCAFVCANLVAFAIEAWSSEEALRFPRPGRSTQQAEMRPFPLIGECGRGEYMFLMLDLMLITGAAAYFAAGWLESYADD